MRRYTLEERARILRALGTHSRMQIIEVLKRGPLDVGDLAGELGISQSAVSQHLKVLKEMGLVRDQRHSYFISYSLDHRSLARLEQMIARVFQISAEQQAKRKRFERMVRKERLLQLREHLASQLEQIDAALKALEEEGK